MLNVDLSRAVRLGSRTRYNLQLWWRVAWPWTKTTLDPGCSAARLSRISTVIRTRETCDRSTRRVEYIRSLNRVDFTDSPNVGQSGIESAFCALRQIANSIRVHARARSQSNEARSTINSACHVELVIL